MPTNVTCLLCGEKKNKRLITKDRNEHISDKFGFCKECVANNVDDNVLSSVINMLRMLNIPFVEDVWENAFDKEEENAFNKYLQLIATQKKYKVFADSEYESGDPNTVSKDDFEVTDDLITRWGVKDSKEEYIELEGLFNQLLKIKEPSTSHEERRYVQNVKLGKAMDETLESGDVKAVPQLRKAYIEDLENLGLNVDSNDDEAEKTLGTRILEWEKHSPIPTSEEYTDVDGIEAYVRKWFLLPMKRVFGRASEEEISELYEEKQKDGDDQPISEA